METTDESETLAHEVAERLASLPSNVELRNLASPSASPIHCQPEAKPMPQDPNDSNTLEEAVAKVEAQAQPEHSKAEAHNTSSTSTNHLKRSRERSARLDGVKQFMSEGSRIAMNLTRMALQGVREELRKVKDHGAQANFERIRAVVFAPNVSAPLNKDHGEPESSIERSGDESARRSTSSSCSSSSSLANLFENTDSVPLEGTSRIAGAMFSSSTTGMTRPRRPATSTTPRSSTESNQPSLPVFTPSAPPMPASSAAAANAQSQLTPSANEMFEDIECECEICMEMLFQALLQQNQSQEWSERAQRPSNPYNRTGGISVIRAQSTSRRQSV